MCNCVKGFYGTNCELLDGTQPLSKYSTTKTAIMLKMKFKKTFISEYNDLSSAVSLELMNNYRSFVSLKFFKNILFKNVIIL